MYRTIFDVLMFRLNTFRVHYLDDRHGCSRIGLCTHVVELPSDARPVPRWRFFVRRWRYRHYLDSNVKVR